MQKGSRVSVKKKKKKIYIYKDCQFNALTRLISYEKNNTIKIFDANMMQGNNYINAVMP